jgi:hypothetical protein
MDESKKETRNKEKKDSTKYRAFPTFLSLHCGKDRYKETPFR